MIRLIKKLKEKLGKLTSSGKKKTSQKKEPQKDKHWDERKKELLSNVRSGEHKKREPQSSKAPQKKEYQGKKPVKHDVKKEGVKEEAKAPRHQVKPKTQRPVPPKQQAKPVVKEREPWDVSKFQVEPAEGKVRFHDFDLPAEIMHAISDLGFKYCTPIQAEILSKTLAGKDASGKAQTGTGKTAAFLITILSNFIKNPAQNLKPGSPRALIMAPTRELVMQITNDAKQLSKYTEIKVLTIVGGIDYQKQRSSLNTNIDIVVATPGRLLDFYSKRGIHLSNVEILVIDEADRMMDMGFIPDMRKIIRATPHKDKRQTLLFSATLPPEVLRLASSWTKDSEVVDIEPDQIAGKNVEQIVYIVSADEKYPLLYNTIVQKKLNRVIIFTNRRDEAKRIRDLLYANGLNTEVLSGDVDQRKRMRTLNDFKEGKFNILVATDVAGRGIHVEGISHVINYNLPEDPEDYVHRIGRTGRAGAEGISISFACEDDSFHIPAIEKFLGHKLEFSHPDDSLLAAPPEQSRHAVKEESSAAEKPPQKKYNRNRNYHSKNRPRRKPNPPGQSNA